MKVLLPRNADRCSFLLTIPTIFARSCAIECPVLLSDMRWEHEASTVILNELSS